MQGVWGAITRFEWQKVAPATAFRNSVGMAIPLLVGAALGYPAAGSVASTGALNVAFTDGRDPYIQRAERMVAASIFCGVGVFIGSLCGSHGLLAVAVTLAWAFLAGMLVAVDQAAADIGGISLVTLVIFAAHPLPPDQAFLSGVLAFCGGLLQTGLAVALWPVRRYEPERRALGALYSELSRSAASPVQATVAPAASAEVTEAQKTLNAIALDRNVQAERYLVLLSQAERIRLSLLFLGRSRMRLQREQAAENESSILEDYCETASKLLASIAESISSGQPANPESDCLQQMHAYTEALRRPAASASPSMTAVLSDAVHQMDSLGGQLRSALDLSASTTFAGRVAFERREARTPWRLRLVSAIPILRANLSLDSAIFRHAVRLAVCTALADAIARSTGWGRSYWLPMTVVIVLKPDFTTTFSRGVLRVAGTFAGLALATGIYHVLPETFTTDFVLIVVLMFLLRCYGPANYGILVVAVSGLVVALLASTGVSPSEVIAARALNTVIGGALALAAYAVWPTWERTQLREMMARMLEGYREYFHVVRQSYLHLDGDFTAALDHARHAARLARSNLEASVGRFRAEPGATDHLVSQWTSMLASSHRLIHAIMALEAGLARSQPAPARPAFRQFAHDFEITLHSLAGALRGSPLEASDLPDLRQDHHALAESGTSLMERYAMVNIETDRMTNSLNTLSEQILTVLRPVSGIAAG